MIPGGHFLVPDPNEASEHEKIRYEGTEDQIVDDAKDVDKPDEDEGQQTLWTEITIRISYQPSFH